MKTYILFGLISLPGQVTEPKIACEIKIGECTVVVCPV
jgi:hypothetical protein